MAKVYVQVVCDCGHDLVITPGATEGEFEGHCANAGVCQLADEGGVVLIGTTITLPAPVEAKA